MDVARIKLNGAALLSNCLVPMSEPPLQRGDRFDHIVAIRKTPFGLLEFRQGASVIVRPMIKVITKSEMNFR
jgi:hypothetical protein